MKCPVDGEVLVMHDRNGVEIDYCPKCRGVWLDRGELDKIIERAAPAERPQAATARPDADRSDYAPRRGEHRDSDKGRDWDDDDDRDKYRRKKRGSLLGDLFDF